MAERDIAELGLVIDALQAAEATRRLRELEDQGGNTAKKLAFLEQVANLLKGALAALGVADLISKIVEAQREFDKINSSLITATGSIENAGEAFKALQKFAARTPFDLKQVTESFLKLRNLGLTPSERALTSYGNTAGALGKSLNDMVEAVADAATGEFERLKEFGIKAKQNGDTVALTFQGVTTKIANNAASIEEYLTKMGETKFAGGMALQAATLDGAISNLGDTWQATLRTMAQSGIADVVGAGVVILIESLTNLQAILKALAGDSKGVAKDADSLKLAIDALNIVMETLAVLGAHAGYILKLAAGNFVALTEAISNPTKALDIFQARYVEAGKEWKEVNERSAQIVGAAARSRAAEAAEDAKSTGDKLAKYKVVADAEKTQSAAQKKAADEALAFYKKTIEASDDQIAQLNAELASTEGLTDGQKKAISVLGDLVKFSANLSAAEKRSIASKIEETLRLERLTDARKADRKAIEDAEAAVKKDTDAAWDKVRALDEQIKTYGLSEIGLLKLQAAEYERQMQNEGLSELEQQRLSMLSGATDEQIKKQTQLSKMKADTGFWTSLEDIAHQTFNAIQNGNEGLWERARNTAKNVFFEWLYQMTVKKWIINLGVAASGTGGVSGIAGAAEALGAGSSSSSLSSAASLVNLGKSIYTGFSGGFAASMGGYVTTLGNLFGSTSVSAFGAGMGLTGSQAATAAAAYNGAGMAGTGSALTSGAAAAPYVSIAAGLIAGYMGGNLISGQYGSKATTATGTAIGAAIGTYILPGLGTALGGFVGGLVGGVANRAFGMGDKKIVGQSIEGTLTPTGATGNNLAKWTQKGGWFRSDKEGTTPTALSAEQSTAFSGTYKSILDLSKAFGDTLGVSTAALSTRVQKLAIDFTGLTTEAEKAGALSKFFEGVADTVALELVPNLKKFQVEGESMAATLARLASDYAAVDEILALVGSTIKQTGLAGIELREGLIAAAGGIDALNKGVAYFQDNFYTDAEKLTDVQKKLADALGALGMSGLKTGDDFKAAVKGFDFSRDGAAELYVKLLALAPAFKTITDATDAAAKAAAQTAADAAKAAAQAKADAQKAQDDLAEVLLKGAQSALDALESVVDGAKTRAQAAFDATMKALDDGVSAATSKISNLQTLSETLRRPLVSATTADQKGDSRTSARAEIQAALAIAKASGVLPTAASLQNALSTLGNNDVNRYDSMLDYLREQASTAADLAGLADVADSQKSVAERTLAVLEGQRTAAQLSFDAEISRLDSILAVQRQAVAIATGSASAMQSLPGALAAVQAALLALSTAGKGGNQAVAYAGAKGQIENLYGSILGRQGDAAGLDYWVKALQSGFDLNWIRDQFLNSAEYQSMQTGPSKAPAISGGSDVVGELRILNGRMQMVEDNTSRTAVSTSSSAGSNGQLASQFNAVSNSGSTLLTSAA